MTQQESPTGRFEAIKKRLEAVHAQVDVPHEDGTVVVDTGILDEKCTRYRTMVDRFLTLPDAPQLDDELGKRLVALSVAIDDLAACCRDLKGPLDRLITAIYDRLPDDPESADEAS